ncbi:hypothetical protein M23134_04847 [Microscilla marina ATCC 23134]|uniref:Uncharacterized protein n=1 Tax=Microscilla marina ATCC 23134 TaxID=313606 RepID=A1ZS09_MICM2|nr:hypothetical protein M23134_04847 [Microscilla marina ATCC 23134]
MLLLPNLQRVWILIDFKVNQDFIAKVLCINKEKPKLACHGSCHLSKKLQEQKKQEKKQVPQSQKDTHNILFFSKALTKVNCAYLDLGQLVGYYPGFRSFDLPNKIFHPPQTS